MVLSQDKTRAVVIITNNYTPNLWVPQQPHIDCTAPFVNHEFIPDTHANAERGLTYACEFNHLVEPLRGYVVSALQELDPNIALNQLQRYI